MRTLISKEWTLILAIALFKFLLHVFTWSNYELHRDALLYYSLGQHLDWGYASVPPAIAVVAAFGTWLFGQTEFALRIWPALIGFLSVVVIGKIIVDLKGSTRAILIGGLAFVLSPAFLRSNALFQPVSFDQFFWLLSAWLIIRLVRDQNPRYWLAVGLVGGVAFLTKYSIVFFLIPVMVALLFSANRRLFFSAWFPAGILVGFILIAPNLLWQQSHGWPLFHHLNELQRTQFVHVSVSGFLTDQLLMNLPGVLVWITGFFVFLFRTNESKYRFLPVGFLLGVLLLMVMHGKSYYALGFYSVLFALGGVALEKYCKPERQLAGLVFNVLVVLPMLPLSLPMLNLPRMARYTEPAAEWINRWEDGRVYAVPQDFSDMTGWKELGELVGKTWAGLPDSVKTDCLIFADNYGQAGAVLYYGKPYGCPEPVCLSDQFLIWAPDRVSGKAALLYIDDDRGDIDRLYRQVTEVGAISNPYFRENGLKLFYCTDPVPEFSRFYAHKVGEMKSVYKISN